MSAYAADLPWEPQPFRFIPCVIKLPTIERVHEFFSPFSFLLELLVLARRKLFLIAVLIDSSDSR